MNGFDFKIMRKGFGWTQKDAAKALEVTDRSILTYEKKGPPLHIQLSMLTLHNKAALEELLKLDDVKMIHIRVKALLKSYES